MKKVIIILAAALLVLSFIGCEAEAKPADFLSTTDIRDLLGEDFIVDPDVGVLDPPVRIIEIDGIPFIAEQQIAYLTQNGLTIIFKSVEGNEIKLSISNPATQTYTAQITSVNIFVAQYTVGDDDMIYTTAAPASDGALGLIYDGNTASSEFFRFNAFIAGTSDEAIGIDGEFTDVEVIDQR